MNNFITGLFTLLAALGGIWLKDYLDRNKTDKVSLKQKAIEAYALTNRLQNTHNTNQVICANLIRKHDFDYSTLIEKYPDTTFVDLEKLELLIVENFNNLNGDFLALSLIIIEHSKFLLSIRIDVKSSNISEDRLKEKILEFQKDVVEKTLEIRNQLMEQYINKPIPKPNLYNYINSMSIFFKNFFKKNGG